MWGMGGIWPNEGRSTSMASYNPVMHEIHVLLVDHDSASLLSTTKMLELCSYKVTYSELASGALAMLSSGMVHFDLVMANIHSHDLYGPKLLKQAVNMGIPVVLMSSDDNAFLAMRALDSGAFMCIKKPTTMDVLRCMWQHVVREKARIYKEKERLREMTGNYDYNSMKGIEIRENGVPRENYGIDEGNKYKGKEKIHGHRRGMEADSGHYIVNNKVKRKICTEWTQELHAKFMAAVEQLGEGSCFPKEIMELMNVPGLTRMQVASHLQKCRNDNWRAPAERKCNQSPVPAASSDTDGSGQNKPRRFGSMPRIGQSSNQVNDNNNLPVQGSDMNDNGDGNNLEIDPVIAPQPHNENFMPDLNFMQCFVMPVVDTRIQWRSETPNMGGDSEATGYGN